MKPDLRGLMAPLLAVVALVLVITQTVAALRSSGAWEAKPARRPAGSVESPYVRLDHEIGRISGAPPADNLRDPFAYGGAQVAMEAHPGKPRPVKPAPPPVPVLTAILWDNDARALIHFGARDYTVRSGELFAEFRVVTISRDQVVLDHNGTSMTLRRPIKGE